MAKRIFQGGLGFVVWYLIIALVVLLVISVLVQASQSPYYFQNIQQSL